MKKISFLFLFLLTYALNAQIKGTITEADGKPLPFVTVLVEDTYNGTTSNEMGKYELAVKEPGKYTIVFQSLGFKTKKVKVTVDKFPFIVDVALSDESLTINEVSINTKENPAIAIIRKAIANRKENSELTSRYKADFYSRGIFRIKDAPKKVLGRKLDMFDDILDSTRSGILYLSETVSKIVYQKPDKLKETIIASKLSGDDNGFSFNNAASVNFDFYDNYIPFQVNVVSPIASNAFNYYKYKLEGTFYDDDQHQINKIKVTPRSSLEPAMEGYIYIVDDSFALYGVDLTIKGTQIQTPAINFLTLRQNFNYNSINKIWAKNTQVLDFEAGMLGIKLSGSFTYVYSNFEFEEKFAKNTFTSQVLSFEKEANKKTDDYWDNYRPVPLTEEESTDYTKKDILQTKKKSKTYLDSIDKKRNKFKILKPLTGYNYRNSFKNYEIDYEGILSSTGFNTIQGYNFSTGLAYTKRNPELRTFTTIGITANYGISEDRLRGTAYVTRKFNNISNLEMTISGGTAVAQFNPNNPISRIVNSLATSFFKNNYMKLYDRTFARLTYQEEVVNGLQISAAGEYSRRRELFNTTEESIIRNENGFTSNNPLNPYNYAGSFFETHNLAKFELVTRIRFGQKYWMRPDGKFNIRDEAYPTLYFGYDKGFAGTETHYNYDHVTARMTYDLGLKNKGLLAMNLRAGKFFNAEGIAFIDYRHFNGNRTHVGQTDRYLHVFNLLPYYESSTNDQYSESHFEYYDNGYIINKIPLLNLLQSTLVIGFHNLALPQRKPYQEATIGLDNLGFGKFKVFRFDYVRSYQSGFREDGIIFGIKFLNILD